MPSKGLIFRYRCLAFLATDVANFPTRQDRVFRPSLHEIIRISAQYLRTHKVRVVTKDTIPSERISLMLRCLSIGLVSLCIFATQFKHFPELLTPNAFWQELLNSSKIQETIARNQAEINTAFSLQTTSRKILSGSLWLRLILSSAGCVVAPANLTEETLKQRYLLEANPARIPNRRFKSQRSALSYSAPKVNTSLASLNPEPYLNHKMFCCST